MADNVISKIFDNSSDKEYYNYYLDLLKNIPEEDIVEALRELCKTDLFFLSEFVLRNRDSEAIPFIDSFQGEMCRWLEKPGYRKMLMAPRGHAKCVDEDTNVIMSDGSYKKIKDINIGDNVIGVNEYKIKDGVVSGKVFSGKKECFELKTNNNHLVNITADHRIYTQDGYKVLKDIKVGDYVVSPRAVSDFMWEKVVSIKSVGIKRTYDIEVFGTNSFFGNNILMHNSTVANRNYVVWRIINDPNVTILIVSATLDNAKKKLKTIKDIFEKNETFKALFPELIPQSFSENWTQTMLTVPRTSIDPEPTVEVQGYEGELTSRHYKMILFDDVVGKENSATREQIRKVVNFYTQSLQLLKKPGGEMMVIGTMWSFDDLHNHIIENLYKEFDIYVRSVWAEDRFLKCEDGKYKWVETSSVKTPLYPEMFSLEDIEILKREIIADPLQGMSTWMAQYELKIVDEKTAIFPRLTMGEKNCWFDEEDLVGKKLAFSLSLDPAVSESKEADESAFVVRAIDDTGIWYVIEVFGQVGMREDAIVDKYIELLTTYQIDLATVETISFQRNLKHAIEKRCQEERIFFPYQKLPSGFLQGSKNNSDLKIRGLAPLYTTGKIKFRRGCLETDKLLDQLWRFPRSSKDDRADALSQHLWLPVIATRVYKNDNTEVEELGLDRYGHKQNEDKIISLYR